MKVYLDTCSLQRPLDDQTQLRIRLETEAVLGLISLIESGVLELVSSEVLLYECRRNANPIRQRSAQAILAQARHFVQLTSGIQARAQQLNGSGLMALDALHLAAAEAAQADYFCTCDDKLLRKARQFGGIIPKPVTPIELLVEIENDN